MLAPGTRLGSYEVLSPLGAGGMGEVHKARDLRLDRTVAIKVLPPQSRESADLRDRFEREARTLASLSHPHICTIHDVGQQGETSYLVMEFLHGETLEQTLRTGPMPVDEALRLGVQIADALAAAHRAGIVHRDLKPGNIMLTKSGAKLLDFGLAKATAPPIAGQLSTLPTTPQGVTVQGTILGTFQYMAPEQLEGHEADPRSDVFAFGAVLYEMIAGAKTFEGRSQATLIAAILEHQPTPLRSRSALVSPALEHLIARCLAKDPDNRWQSTSDLHRELAWIAEVGDVGSMALSGESARRTVRARWMAAVAIGGALVVAVAGIATWRALAERSPSPVARLTITLPDGLTVADNMLSLALSPSGTHIAYVATTTSRRQQLHLRRIDQLEATVVPGSELASGPFFSPDGQWVGFFAEGQLKKVSVAAGLVQTVCTVPNNRGGTWAPDGTIYFAASNDSGLWKVSSDGGTPTEVTRLDRARGEISHRWPQILPGGEAVLFSAWTGPGRGEKEVHAHRFRDGQRKVLVRGGENGQYVASGHLVYNRADELIGVPFDVAALQISGEPRRLGDFVRNHVEGAQFAISDAGHLAYVQGASNRQERRLVRVRSDGSVEPLSAPVREYQTVALSADGRFVAAGAAGETNQVAIFDTTRATFTPLVTGAGSSQAPLWTPDGRRITYRGTRAGFRNVWWKTVGDGTSEERLTTGENIQTPAAWTPDASWLVYLENALATGQDIWAMPMTGDRKPRAIVRTPLADGSPRLSPDGKWLAYMSQASGSAEVFVQSFLSPNAITQVSVDGGSEPAWSRDGRQIFYRRGDDMMAADVRTTPAFSADRPRKLYTGSFFPSPTANTGYDVMPDGSLIRIQSLHPDPPSNRITVVLNWIEELTRQVPH